MVDTATTLKMDAWTLYVQRAREEGYQQGLEAATWLPESNYGATQSCVVLLHFTSFQALRDAIRMRRWRSEGERPGRLFAGDCRLVSIVHGDNGQKCAVAIVSSHRDI